MLKHSNLAGLPARWSPATQAGGPNRRVYNGFVKLRLAHSNNGTYFIPELLIAVGGTRYFLPSYFSPPCVGFNIEPGKHFADFSVDVGPSRATELQRLFVLITSEDRIFSYEDGAQMYKCTFDGPRRLASFAHGLCKRLGVGSFSLQVFHHTLPINAASIKETAELWSSPWNLAGTRKLKNVAYVYFTTLSQINGEEDLRRIAMSSDETIHFQTTSDRKREEVLSLKVYRGSTADLTAALAFDVPCALIAPPHLYLHPNIGVEAAWYETINPEIIRIGVLPSAKMQISGSKIDAAFKNLKNFSYVIVGDASTLDGLAAPYNEEDTKQIAHLEVLDDVVDLFDFWIKNQNSDQISGRIIEPRTFA